jgi:peptide/nickel transport system permease protein
MLPYIFNRILWGVIALWAVTVMVFLVVHLSGDPTALYVSQEGTEEDYRVMRSALGFDQPWSVQYGRFFLRVVHGDFGSSLRFHQPALSLAIDRFPATIQLAAVSMALAASVALPLGILASVQHNSAVDNAALLMALWGQCMPTFWLGLLLLLAFGVDLRLVPVIGGTGPIKLVLPAVTLGAWAMARTTRITRSSMLEVLRQDFLRTARAKGTSHWRAMLRHALRNAAIPIVTTLGLDFGNLLGGAVITEAVFAYPGIGRLAVDAVVTKDLPLVQAVVFVIAAVLIALNLCIDILYVALDPRVRLG